jgi:hypothetical protein
MTKLLLILILVAGNEADPTAQALAAQLKDLGQDRIQVVVGVPAAEELAKRGVHDSDLMGAPEVGAALTTQDRDLAVVRLERVDRGPDAVLETRIWLGGRSQSHVAISGVVKAADPADGTAKADPPAVDPTPGAIRGTLAVLGPWLATVTADRAGPSLSRLAELGDWGGLLTAAMTGISGPRERYYQVLAHARLGHGEEAAAALASLKAEHPGHFLITAAEALVVPAHAELDGTVNETVTGDDGSNVLR